MSTTAFPGTATVRQADSVYDPLRSVELLTDPSALEFIATQLNDETQNGNIAQGAPRIKDLTACIIDIIEDTVAQGASTLEVHIYDPAWVLFLRHGDAPAFFDVDDAGLLIPVDVNLPQNTDRWWRLASMTKTVDPTQPHILLFEDRIVTELRDNGGARHAGKNQTRAEFIYGCVRLGAPDARFVCPALAQPAGSVGGNLTEGQVDTTGVLPTTNQVAASALNANAPSARRNPAKRPGIGRGAKNNGAVWTSKGWRYPKKGKKIDGLTPKELSILNPPTNGPDDSPVGPVVGGTGGGLGGF